ncbi:hypothetical protein GUK34_37010, partial [Rhizobium leguminosarum]|nr:hypothetical protein [Rhizobium ruizarguesonis]
MAEDAPKVTLLLCTQTDIPTSPPQIGGADFTVFRTTKSKSRLNFLSLLRGGYQDYVLGDAAFDYL